MIDRQNLDDFTTAYITAMLWSSTLPAFGTCEKCGRENAILCEDDDLNQCDQCFDPHRSRCEPPADDNYGIYDLTEEAMELIVEDCRKFQEENKADLAHNDAEQGGHDFWLTRAGHGCGYWDGDWPEEVGDRLTEASKKAKERYLEVTDEGKVDYR